MLKQVVRVGRKTNQRAGGRRFDLSGERLSILWTGPEEERPPGWYMMLLQDWKEEQENTVSTFITSGQSHWGAPVMYKLRWLHNMTLC